MTASLLRKTSSQRLAIRALLVSCTLAVTQSGCLGDLDVGETSPLLAPGTSTGTATDTNSGTGTATDTHTAPTTATSTQTDLSVEPACERISLEPGVLNPCGRITGLAYSPDGAYLASSSYDHSADSVVWRMSDGQRVARLAGKDWAGSVAIAFSPDGRYLASGAFTTPGDTGVLRLWEVATGQLVYSVQPSVGSYAGALAWSPDSSLLAIAGASPGVEVWSVPNGQLVQKLATGNTTHNVHFSPDGTRLLAASVDGQARIWNVADWSPLGFTLAIADEMADATYAPNRSQIASTGWSDSGIGEVRLWDANTGALLQTLSTRATPISHTLWISQDVLLANDWGGVVSSWTRQSDGLFQLSGTWSTAGSATGTMPGAGELGRSIALAISPQGTNLVAGGMDPATNKYGFMFLAR